MLPSAKSEARDGVPAAASYLADAGQTVLVRVNRPWEILMSDLDAVVCSEVHGLVLPKTDRPAVVSVVDEILTELEIERSLKSGHTKRFIRIESARGLRRVDEILAATPRVVATAIGSGDLLFSAGLDVDGAGLPYSHLTVVTAALAAGVLPLGLPGTIVEFNDLDEFRRFALRAKGLGIVNAPCIHSRQVSILNDVFSSTQREIDRAGTIVSAFAGLGPSDDGAFMVDGELVDVAMHVQALQIRSIVARMACGEGGARPLESEVLSQ